MRSEIGGIPLLLVDSKGRRKINNETQRTFTHRRSKERKIPTTNNGDVVTKPTEPTPENIVPNK